MNMKTGDTGSGDLIERLEAGARVHRQPRRTPDCPDEEQLRLLLAGQVEPEEAETLLNHSADCDWCGTVLREAAQDLSGPPTMEEEELAAKSRWADPRRRRKLAKRITNPKPSGPKPSFLMWRWWPAPAMAAAAAAMAGVFFQMGYLGGLPGAERLTCRAYAEQRELSMRLMACPAYSPIHTERAVDASRLSRPDFVEAFARVARGAEAHPDDPSWLELQGRMDLMDGKDDAAISKLERARSLRPKDARILSVLGVTYFHKAQSRKDDQKNYILAFERLSEASAVNPKDPALLFDRALAAEKISAFSQARNDWQAYLQLDSSSGWAREATAHLDELKKNSTGSGSMLPPQPPTR